MAVVAIADIPGMTREQYDKVASIVKPEEIRHAGGLLHISGATETGWRVIEVWESREAQERFVREKVLPNMPPEVPLPSIQFMEVHTMYGLSTPDS